MERYSEYKDSGVQWLGEIPGHWERTKVSRLFKQIGSGTTPSSGDTSLYANEGTPWLQSGDFNDNEINSTSKFITDKALDNYSLKLYNPGGVVIAMYGASIGKVGLLNIATTVNQACCVLSDSDFLLQKYTFYVFVNEKENLVKKSKGGTQPNISQEIIKSHYIPLPPLSEQRAIVSYLDDKCGKIDKLLEGKQKQIELLAEMKQRIIADAVTRGLNPNVKMKATNIPWLPEIPEHWEVKRSKNLFNKEQRPIEEGDDIVTCFRDGEVTLRKNRRTTGFTEATDYSHYQHICKGDLVIHQMDAFAGASGVSDSDGMGTPVLSVCTAKIEGLNHYYYAYILRLMGKNNFILSLYRGIRERSSNFRFETFAKQYLPVPPAAEQNDIVAYINERSIKIDTLTSKLQQEIESIKEYKQRLISDVVTGQIKVC